MAQAQETHIKKSVVRDLTEGSPMKLILGFMLPLLLGLLFQQMYNMADTVIVGRYLGMNALAGVGSTGAVNFFVIGFVIGICTGFSIPIAQKFGLKDYSALRKYAGNTLWVCLFFAVLLTAAVCILCPKILTAMRTPEEVFNEAYDYIFIIFLGIPASFLYNSLSGIIRSLGDSKTPVIILVISSLVNIALDILLIAVLGAGVWGAALATVSSQLVSGLICLGVIIKRFDILKLSKGDLVPDLRYIGSLCASGIPMGLQYSITAIGTILIQSAVNSLGPSTMAAVTSASKVSQFMCCPFDAMGSTMTVYGGQNIGAGKYERVKKGLLDCCILGVIWALTALCIVLLFGEQLVSMFIDRNNIEEGADIDTVISLGRHFLVINASFYWAVAFVNIVRFLIQGMGFSQVALFAGIFELAARAAAALKAVPLLGFDGVCAASPAAWILADIFLIPAFFACFKYAAKKHTKKIQTAKEGA